VLKCVSKARAVQANRQESVMSEARTLASLASPFITRLHGTFQTSDELVMVVHPITGGDLWT
jgi:serine/threonine protein kinase